MEIVRHFPHQQADHDGLNTRAPHDAEAEALVISAVMHDTGAYQSCAEILDREDFYKPAHRLIWDTVAGLVAAGTPPHPALVRTEIERAGRLSEVDGGQLIYRLGSDYLPGSTAPHFAQQVADKARDRRFDEHANRLKFAIQDGATGDELASLVADFQQAEQLREATGHGPAHLVSTLLDWGTFFATDFGSIQLLPGRLMGPGQQITVVGDGKAGKSLFTQEWMWRMASGQSFLGDKPQDPVRVLYLDAENGQEQVQERFLSFGAGPRNMGELQYASFPPVRPLDTAGGGADLMSMVKATGAELVVIDTVSRFISGPENDADTWLNLYRHTLLPLKRDRISSVRLDHRGKDSERGARGSSAKTQDVDHVWELSALGGGALALKRTHTRTGIGPDHFDLVRQARKDGDNWAHGGTRHILMTWENEPSAHPAVPGTVEHIIASLDAAGLPDDAGNRVARQTLADRQIPGGNDKIAEAVRRRKARSKMSDSDVSGKRSGDRSDGRFPETFPGTHHGTEETAGQTFPGTLAETSGTPPVPHVPPSKRGNGEGTPEQQTSETPCCTVCNTPLHGYRLDRGYDTCLEHDTPAA
ncbi:AAA family ATPase [Streptomyces sp. MSC1_001]|uniref:AAA family ATPase n=1 Tax=Streptomyces sp. MSC1_001 TaxID=2909263 RepID=UPI00202EA4F4|nr:AAA family ATPase [Streptomyces sp. MSC1_001]